MEYSIKERFNDDLLPDEYIVWCGMPNPGVHFSKSDIFVIPFSLLWAGFAVFWNVMVWVNGAPLLFRIFGLPFLIMGIYITLGRFIHLAHKKKRTFYAITNMRVLILTGRDSVLSQYIRDIPTEQVTVGKNGAGTIVFGAANGMRSASLSINDAFGVNGARTAPPSFTDINDCRKVYAEYQAVKHRLLYEA